MTTCSQCIYWQKVKSLKDYGECTVEVPPWVIISDRYDYTLHRDSKLPLNCNYFREEQEDV